MPSLSESRDWADFPDPLLIIEVLSPSSAHFDRFRKRRRFPQRGIPEYWIVDLDARAIERWRPEDERPEVLDERLHWYPPGAAAPLEIDLPTYFREIWGH